MIFLVPDLDVLHRRGTRVPLPLRDTAPGPLLETADEVVEQLRDLGGLARAHADAYARFNATYNYLQDGTSAARVVQEFFADVHPDVAPRSAS